MTQNAQTSLPRAAPRRQLQRSRDRLLTVRAAAAGKAVASRGGQSRGDERDVGAVRQRLSRRPARSAPEHVPRVRLIAGRPPHAPDGERAQCGSACCVYGLTFTSHFYGAKRTVGYVPFNSETLVTGKLFEDIRDAVFKLADPDDYDAIVVINLCVPDRVRRAAAPPAEGDQRRAHHRHRRTRFRRADPCRSQGRPVRRDAAISPGWKPSRVRFRLRADNARRDPPLRCSARCFRPTRCKSARCSICWASQRGRSFRRGNGGNFMARLIARRSPRFIPSTPPACVSSRQPAVRSSAPRQLESKARRLGSTRSARPAGSLPPSLARRRTSCSPAIGAALARSPIRGRATSPATKVRNCLSARLMVESGADLRYVGTACPSTRFSDADREWLEAKGVKVQFRASLQQDLAALEEFEPDLAIGTTPVVQKAKERAIPALYFTNLISARPLMGVAGASSLATRSSTPRSRARAGSTRCGLSSRASAKGIRRAFGRITPRDHPDFKARRRRKNWPSPRSRRWAHASPRPRQGGRLLGRRLRLHRDQRACKSSSMARSAAKTCR